MPNAATSCFPDTVSAFHAPEPAGDTPSAAGVNYELPLDRIAQTPVSPRDASRLLVVARHDVAAPIDHKTFRDLPDLLRRGDLLVVNETRVSALRLFGARSSTGGQVEVLLLRPATEYEKANTWACLVKPGRKIQVGDHIEFADAGLTAFVLDRTPDGGRILQFVLAGGNSDTVADPEAVEMRLQDAGRVPLPPYITAPLTDASRYQTVYAHAPGSAAAPTAGLHFTPELLAQLEASGVEIAKVRLDVGLGTFRPMRSDNPAEHEMHRETFCVPEETARAVNGCRGRVVAVGTTSLRALETAGLAAAHAGDLARVRAMEGETGLFVYPGSGHIFRAVDGLITNFHQPHSTLLLLVAAFCGPETMRRAYQTALDENYRFLSFGDAMIALPSAHKN